MTVPPQPAAPADYTLCGYEVTTAGIGHMKAGSGGVSTRMIFAGNAAGLARAWSHWLTIPATERRLTAVAWWLERSLDECDGGRERVVSEYQPGVPVAVGQWSPWRAVEAVGEQAAKRDRRVSGRA